MNQPAQPRRYHHHHQVKLNLQVHEPFRDQLRRQLRDDDPLLLPNAAAANGSSGHKNLTRSEEVRLRNFQDVMYTAPIQIDQSFFSVIVDTGSSDLWVTCAAFANDPEIPCATKCPSSAAIIRYGSGNVCVLPTQSSIQLGNVQINDYVVGIAQGSNVMPGAQDALLQGGAQGILGLAYPSIATVPSPNGQFIDQIGNFSINLSPSEDPAKSFLLLNGVDEQLIQENNMTGYFIPLKEPAHWTVSLGEIHWDDTVLSTPCAETTNGYCDAILDTGTSLVSMPSTVFNQFVTKYLTNCVLSSPSNGVYVCPQSTSLPTFGFTLGSAKTGWTTFQLSPKDYTMVDPQSNRMIVELQANPKGLANTWILGDTFLRSYYSLYLVNEGVTLYCANGACKGAGSVPGSKGNSSDSNSSNATKWYASGVFWTVVIIVLGLVAVAFGVMALYRRRKAQERARQMNVYTIPQHTPLPPEALVVELPGQRYNNHL